MHSTTVFTLLSTLALAVAQRNTSTGVTGALGDAPIITDNPVGPVYIATLPDRNTTDIRGFVSATANTNGTGVVFTIDVSGFTFDVTDEYIYHIHDQPVPPNGDCKGTLAHQDPTIRGEQPPCNAAQPQTCQVGDLSGKHGNITTETFQTSYVDLYASTKEGIGAFFGNRSIVFHTANTTRLNCANFTLEGGMDSRNMTSSSSGSSSSSSSGTSATSSPAPFTGAGAMTFVSWSTLFGGLAAALYFY